MYIIKKFKFEMFSFHVLCLHTCLFSPGDFGIDYSIYFSVNLLESTLDLLREENVISAHVVLLTKVPLTDKRIPLELLCTTR